MGNNKEASHVQERVLVGVDGRQGGRDVIALAAHLVDQDGKLTLAHAQDGDLRLSHALAPDLVREQPDVSHALLEQERASPGVVTIPTAASAGIVPAALGESVDVMLREADSHMKELPDADSRAVYGLPGEELVAFSDEVDLLIVGSRGYGPIRRLVLGSTSDYLERHARCALLVLPRMTTGEGSHASAAPPARTGTRGPDPAAKPAALPAPARVK